MNFLTKAILIVAISITTLQLSAQTFGVKAGYSLSSMLDKDNDYTYSDEYDNLSGFHLGAIVNFPLSETISVEPGLIYTSRGFRSKESNLDIKVKTSYIDIPIPVKYTYKAFEKFNVYGAIGPYIGVGIGGKIKIKSGDTTTKTDLDWGTGSDDLFRRFDAGLTIGAGVEVDKIQFGLGYDLGLVNVASQHENGYTNRNRLFKISIGYMF